jgi:toxin-antitoxin system PIN domain toxin
VDAEAGDLPDINVWLALAAPSHPHHAQARAYWERADLPRLWFNRVTMLGLVRLLCEPKVMGAATLTLSRALRVYEYFEAVPEVGFAAEPVGCAQTFHAALGAEPGRSPRLLTDVYLACHARVAGMRLVTFDRDFERLNLCPVLRLSGAAH